jgi:hypothetical protein
MSQKNVFFYFEAKPDIEKLGFIWAFLGRFLFFFKSGYSSFLVIDSSGRPLPGVLKGNNIFMGLVKECEDISYAYTDTSRSFRGQYIRVFINQALLDYKVGCEHTRSYYWDLCLPYDCTHEDLLKVFRRRIF